MVSGLVDSFGRRITYLRLSVTDRCDLRCVYCMPERMQFLPKEDMLSLEELAEVAFAFVARGVRKIRLTGGEPLVRRDVLALLQRLQPTLGAGVDELTLTTNGMQLAKLAEPLAAAGVRRINVSLDTLDRARFATLARRDGLPQVLDGIAAATAAGISVKINTVALQGLNEEELPDIIAWAHGQGHAITLIEVMPLGEVDADRYAQHLSLAVVREKLERRWTLTPSLVTTGGPARYFDVAETGGQLGLITPLTHNFCAGCNRVRVTATGQLYSCLGDEGRIDLRTALRQGGRAALEGALDLAMLRKPERHAFIVDRPYSSPAVARHMSVTGG